MLAKAFEDEKIGVEIPSFHAPGKYSVYRLESGFFRISRALAGISRASFQWDRGNEPFGTHRGVSLAWHKSVPCTFHHGEKCRCYLVASAARTTQNVISRYILKMVPLPFLFILPQGRFLSFAVFDTTVRL